MLTGHWDEEGVANEVVENGEGGKVEWRVIGKTVEGIVCDVEGLEDVWVVWEGDVELLDVGWEGEVELLDVGCEGEVDLLDVGGTEVEGVVRDVGGAWEVETVVVELLKHPIKSSVMLWASSLGVILMAVTILKKSINWPLTIV